ncbi:glutamine--fructose-6-phosphate aminotransferase [isomerizing] [Allostella sp. ATCC 35155]|nr:glutamine--fructose-6-phosphate aminotransferase [isomerizing] [Stella sp. ATCC 35155]
MASKLIDSLRRLEYRGYDSAGIAVVGAQGLDLRRASGCVDRLAAVVRDDRPEGTVGIAHTRWATHGAPTDVNAHPHAFDGVAVVHNGIVENHAELKWWLSDLGHEFVTETDSEVLPHIIAKMRRDGMDHRQAVAATLEYAKGSLALAAVFEDAPDRIVVARRGSPLAVAISEDGAYVSSDPAAFDAVGGRFTHLEDGEVAELTRGDVWFDGADGDARRNRWEPVVLPQDGGDPRAGHSSFMAKEMAEQPDAWSRTVASARAFAGVEELAAADRIAIVACGSSYYAGLMARAWFEREAGLACDIEVASEFRHRGGVLSERQVVLCLSQSGETADTLAVIEEMRAAGRRTFALVNTARSAMTRAADRCWLTDAGREIGVAATKTFTAQVAALVVLALRVAHARGRIDADRLEKALDGLASLSDMIRQTLALEGRMASAASAFADRRSAFYLGRGPAFAAALEGALKLKEIGYVQAEAYAAGELKHGPIALIEPGVPVVVVAPSDHLFEKTLSSAQEVKARGARLLLLTDAGGAARAGRLADDTVVLPGADAWAVTVSAVIALQFLARHIATARGLDVDRPRNLAKSVTVE